MKIFCTLLCGLAVMFTSGLLPAHAQEAFEGWRHLGSTDTDVVYFQLKSVRTTDDKTTKAWVRYQYRKTPAEQESEYREARGSVTGFDEHKYLYILELQEFDCGERRSRTHSVMRYDIGNKYLGGVQRESPKWHDVVPGSIGESALEAVCQYRYEQLLDFFEDVPSARPKAKTPRRPIKRKRA